MYNLINNRDKYNCENYFMQIHGFEPYINEVPISMQYGFMEMHVTKNLGTEEAIGAILTIFVNKNGSQIPVTRLRISQNPTLITLPIAYPSGNLVKGAEYYYTPYNLTIEDEGFYRIMTQNIRLFPNITAVFFYNLNKIIMGEPGREQIIVIPPHPRD